MPAQNARPAPVTTTARTASSVASVRKNSSSSRAIVTVKAFSGSGRCRVRVATPSSSTSPRSVSHSRGVIAGARWGCTAAGAGRRSCPPGCGRTAAWRACCPSAPPGHAAARCSCLPAGAHRHRELGQVDRAGALADPDRGRGRLVEVEVAHRVEEGPRRLHLVPDRADDLALVGRALHVAERLERVPVARERQRRDAVDLLAALLDVQAAASVVEVVGRGRW